MVVLITCSLEIIHYANSCLHCNWGAVSVYLVTYRYVMIISSFYCHLFSLMIYGSFVISWFPYMHCISMCIGSFFDIILWCTDYYLYSWRFFGAAYFSTHQLVGAGVCVCVGMRVYVCVCVWVSSCLYDMCVSDHTLSCELYMKRSPSCPKILWYLYSCLKSIRLAWLVTVRRNHLLQCNSYQLM